MGGGGGIAMAMQWLISMGWVGGSLTELLAFIMQCKTVHGRDGQYLCPMVVGMRFSDL